MRPSLLPLFLLACNGGDPDATYQEPVLTLESPAPASWTPTGPTTAIGLAENLVDVKVNGEDAAIDGNAYSHELSFERGINTVEVRASDSRGDDLYLRNSAISGEFISPTDPVNDAAWIRLNRSGLDLMLGQVGTLIDKQTINESLAIANPVLDTTIETGGLQLGTLHVDLVSIDFADLWVTGEPLTDELALVVHLDQMVIDAQATGDTVGLPYDVAIGVYADTADVRVSLTVGVVDGHLDLTIGEVITDLTSVTFDTSLLPPAFEQNLVIGSLEPALEAQIATAVAEQVPPLITQLTAGLDLSFHTELMGFPIDAFARFAEASIDPDGLALQVDIDARVQGNAGYPYQGYLTAAGMGDAVPDRTQDLAMSVYDDLLNRILFEVWKAGMLEQTLTTEDGSLNLTIVAMLGGTDSGSIDIKADLPPVVVDDRGQLSLQLGELIVDISTPGGALGEQLSMAVAGSVPLTPIVDNGVLKLTLGTPDLVLSVRGTTSQASTEALTQLLEENLPISMLLGVVADLQIPLPTFAGMSVNTALAQRDGTGAWTQLLVDLEVNP